MIIKKYQKFDVFVLRTWPSKVLDYKKNQKFDVFYIVFEWNDRERYNIRMDAFLPWTRKKNESEITK